MNEILNIIFTHPIELLFTWFGIFFAGMVMMRKTYWSLLDPFVIQFFLAIAPGLAGICFIVFYTDYYPGIIYKSVLLFSSITFFFFFHNISFAKKKIQAHEIILKESMTWQMTMLVITTLITICNILINGNYNDGDPSLRFSNVTSPFLNYMSIAFGVYPAIILSFTRRRKVMLASVIFILINTLFQLQVGASKSFFISFLMIYIFWGFSRNKLNIVDIKKSIKNLRVPKELLVFTIVSFCLVIPALMFMFFNGIANTGSILARFLLTLDSPAIFIVNSNIQVGTPSSVTGFHNFLEVWFKPFLKNLIGVKYEFENISQYLTFEISGYSAKSYEESSWQPNNNIIVDFLVIHGWLGVLLAALFGFLFGKMHCAIKSLNAISRWSFPLFVLAVISPYYAFTDAQAFFTSAILTLFTTYVINFFYRLIVSVK
jgi:hypothetical protein